MPARSLQPSHPVAGPPSTELRPKRMPGARLGVGRLAETEHNVKAA